MEAPIPIKGETTTTSVKFDVTKDASEVPVLEMRLVDTEKVNGNLVETYREFEVKKDEAGNIIESKPTDNYEYISYELNEDADPVE